MIYSIEGKLAEVKENFFVVVCGGVGFKIFSNKETLGKLTKEKPDDVKVFSYLYVRENQVELYGFTNQESVALFEMLNDVQGVGPRTALGILDIDAVPNVVSAIVSRNFEFLTRTSGIGRKTAERIVLELHNKIKLPYGDKISPLQMGQAMELEEILVNLGYSRRNAREVVRELEVGDKTLEENLRKALKLISRK